MAVNENISVKICGNPESSSGLNPLYTFNSPNFEVKDSLYAGFDKCSCFYIIKTTGEQRLYKLVKNRVRSQKATREGTLVIAFSVPKDYGIDGDCTPYDVLEKLKNAFLENFMTCKDNNRETYEFKKCNLEEYRGVLDGIAGKFTISPQPSPYRVMDSGGQIGYIVKSRAEIQELFHDINYPEFKQFREVVVAESVDNPNATLIDNIQIPRPKSYEIYVDNKLLMTCTDENQLIPVSSHEPSEYYDNDKACFTIQWLRDGRDSHKGIVFDEVNERVVVSTKDWATPKKRTIKLKIVPDEHESYFRDHRDLFKVERRYETIRLNDDWSFTLVGEQIADIKNNTIRVSLEPNGKYRMLPGYEFFGDELRVTVEEIPQPSYNSQGVRYGNDSCQQQGSAPGHQANGSFSVDISVRLNSRNENGDNNNEQNRNDDKQGKGNFKKKLRKFTHTNASGQPTSEKINLMIVSKQTTSKRPKGVIASCQTTFKPISDGKTEGRFYVSQDVLRNNTYLYLYFRRDNRCYKTKKPLYYMKNGKVDLEDKDFESSEVKKPFYKKKIFYSKLIPAVIILPVLIWFIKGKIPTGDSRGLLDEAKQNNVTQVPSNDSNSMTTEEAAGFLQVADHILQREDLQFREVNYIYNQYNQYDEIRNVIDSVDQQKFGGKVCDKIKDYYKVVSYVTNGKVEDLEKALNQKGEDKLHVSDTHQKLLKLIVRNESTIKQFHDEYSKIKAFNEIDNMISLPQSQGDNSGGSKSGGKSGSHQRGNTQQTGSGTSTSSKTTGTHLKSNNNGSKQKDIDPNKER